MCDQGLCGKQDYFRASYRLGSNWSDSPSPGSVLSEGGWQYLHRRGAMGSSQPRFICSHALACGAYHSLRLTGPLTSSARGCSFDRANFALGSTVSICSSVESIIFLEFAVVAPRKSSPKLRVNSSQMLLGHASLSSQRSAGV